MERLKGGLINTFYLFIFFLVSKKKKHKGIRLQSFTGCLERRVELEPLVYRAMAQREGELMVNLLFDF